MILSSSLQLPCGDILNNRFAKSAMSEILGSISHGPTPELIQAYAKWVEGQCGLLITGNVMVDKNALGEPKNVVIEDDTHIKDLKKWAATANEQSKIWVQLNHPGKQSPSFLSSHPVAPSAIPLSGSLRAAFNTPRALNSDEIKSIIQRFAHSSEIVKKAGFSGVQIHGAHGYLVSQFLSPKHNQRSDEWGGNLENRMRFGIEVYRAIRAKVGASFPVSIKLNSSDFQKGGFTEEESLIFVKTLASEGIDLIEISGGNYERPAMMGIKHTTQSREAYFAAFANQVRTSVSTPIMLTGGFRTAKAMEQAIKDGICDLVGLARPLALDPELPKKIIMGDLSYTSPVHALTTGFSFIDKISMLNITWYEQQIARLGKGKKPNAKLHPLLSIIRTFCDMGLSAFRARRA